MAVSVDESHLRLYSIPSRMVEHDRGSDSTLDNAVKCRSLDDSTDDWLNDALAANKQRNRIELVFVPFILLLMEHVMPNFSLRSQIANVDSCAQSWRKRAPESLS